MGHVHATSLFSGPETGLKHDAVLAHEGGVIVSVNAATQAEPGRRLVIPALVNAHDHARPTASSFGSLNMPLEIWILRSPLITPPDPYLTAAVSFGRNARAGTGAMMVHYTKPSGRMGMVDEARPSPAPPVMSASVSPLHWRCATRIRWSMAMPQRFSPACRRFTAP